MARNYSNIATQATLSASIDAVTTSATISDDTGWPAAEFTVKCEDEVMLCTARTGTSLTLTRGYDGTTAASHASSTEIYPAVVALDFADTFARLEGHTTADPITGPVRINLTGPAVKLRSSLSGASAVAYMTGYQSDGTREGYVGDPGSGAEIRMQADIGDLSIDSTTDPIVVEDNMTSNVALDIDHTGTIGGTTLTNAWLIVGGDGTSTGMGFDPNEIYVATGQDLYISSTTGDANLNVNGTTRLNNEFSSGIQDVVGTLTVSGDFAMNGTNLYSNGDWYIRRNGAADGDYYFIDNDFHRFYLNGVEEFRAAVSTITYGRHLATGDVTFTGDDLYSDGNIYFRTDSASATTYHLINDTSHQVYVGGNRELYLGTGDVRIANFLHFNDGTTDGIRASGTTYVAAWTNNAWHTIFYNDRVQSRKSLRYDTAPSVGTQNWIAYWDDDYGSSQWHLGTTYSASSATVKKNIRPLNVELFGSKLLEIPLKRWDYDNDALEALGADRIEDPTDFKGYILEDIKQHVPMLSKQTVDGLERIMDGRPMYYVQIAAAQYLNNRINELTDRVVALEAANGS